MWSFNENRMKKIKNGMEKSKLTKDVEFLFKAMEKRRIH
jgi:hypothetical protein